MPDPYCIAVNAFNFSWKTHKRYTFPPFSLVGTAISKLIRGNTTGIMIIRKQTTQYWFQTMLAHLIDHPIQLPSGLKTLFLLFKLSKGHPLSPRFQLLAVEKSLAQFVFPREIEEFLLTSWKPKTATKIQIFHLQMQNFLYTRE